MNVRTCKMRINIVKEVKDARGSVRVRSTG